MKSEMEKALAELLEEKFNQVVVAIRASHPSAQDIKNLNAKLDDHITTHEKYTKEINAKLDPVYQAFQTASGFKATVILIATTLGGIWASIEAFKKLTGK